MKVSKKILLNILILVMCGGLLSQANLFAGKFAKVAPVLKVKFAKVVPTDAELSDAEPNVELCNLPPHIIGNILYNLSPESIVFLAKTKNKYLFNFISSFVKDKMFYSPCSGKCWAGKLYNLVRYGKDPEWVLKYIAKDYLFNLDEAYELLEFAAKRDFPCVFKYLFFSYEKNKIELEKLELPGFFNGILFFATINNHVDIVKIVLSNDKILDSIFANRRINLMRDDILFFSLRVAANKGFVNLLKEYLSNQRIFKDLNEYQLNHLLFLADRNLEIKNIVKEAIMLKRKQLKEEWRRQGINEHCCVIS